jgi:glycosyltransferase involved in cell wall biosynthesis
MKILFVIDHFGGGGAQRQIVELACGLDRRGHAVEMFTYFPQYDFFRPQLDKRRIVVHEYRKGRGFSLGVVGKLASLTRSGGFDVVVSYLNSANIYAELATLVSRKSQLVVSERTSHHDDSSWLAAQSRRLMHGVADWVVVNSQAHCDWLRRKWWLEEKVSCIYNGVDLGVFYPSHCSPPSPRQLRLLAIGRIGPEKNLLNIISALGLLYEEQGFAPEVSWVGDRDGSAAGRLYCSRVDDLLDSLPEIRKRWSWLGVQTAIPQLLWSHHALIHASFYEGLPNVVCEALAAGMPVLVSHVCDHSLLVPEGERGFLFDPMDPLSIACAIEKLMKLDVETWRNVSSNAREYAESSLSIDRMVSEYEALFARLAHNRHRGANRHFL